MKIGRCALAALLALGCGDSGSEPPVDGVDVAEGPCGHALYVINSDYQSSSVAVIGYDGEVLSSAIVSSASETTGLSVPLSKDTVAPTARTVEGAMLLLDREQAVLTVLDPVSATVTSQIQLATGFNGANPQDVIEVGAGTLYVSRYGANANAGAEPFDAGSDVLVVDSASGEVDARIDLASVMEGAPAGIFPNPSRMVKRDDHVFLLLSAYSKSFAMSDDGRVAVLDATSHAVASFAVVTGMRGCSALALSPSGQRLAVGCSGTFGGDAVPSLEDSGVVVFSVGANGDLDEEQRFSAVDLGGDPISFSLSFAGDQSLVFATFGRKSNTNEQERPDRLMVLALESGETQEVARSETTPFTIGEVHCAAACGVCFAADAERLGVLRVPFASGAPGAAEVVSISDGIGLPPRYLGAY
jgi:hypothetical protein